MSPVTTNYIKKLTAYDTVYGIKYQLFINWIALKSDFISLNVNWVFLWKVIHFTGDNFIFSYPGMEYANRNCKLFCLKVENLLHYLACNKYCHFSFSFAYYWCLVHDFTVFIVEVQEVKTHNRSFTSTSPLSDIHMWPSPTWQWLLLHKDGELRLGNCNKTDSHIVQMISHCWMRNQSGACSHSEGGFHMNYCCKIWENWGIRITMDNIVIAI